MYCNALSVDTRCFLDKKNTFVDRYQIFDGLKKFDKYFSYRNIDLGPYESFYNYNSLKGIVHRAATVGFFPRLQTSGGFFTDKTKTIEQFIELQKLGLGMVVLRLDDTSINSINMPTILNYVAGSSAIGQSICIRYDLDTSVPEKLYSILKEIEATRFYSEVIFKKKRILKRKRILPQELNSIDSLFYRLVLSNTGRLTVRPEDEDSEYSVGRIGNRSFTDLLGSIFPMEGDL